MLLEFEISLVSHKIVGQKAKKDVMLPGEEDSISFQQISSDQESW